MKLENVAIVANPAGGNYIKSYALIGKYGYVQSVAELSILICIIKYFKNNEIIKDDKIELIF
ncbi:hypothetical protein [Methanobacterium sp.]|jgi:hypothetical protein|uniref:hypothetical protein n=1 Tax=Methanobacterium sp. TaxID=2164 RepID=UPI003157FC74